MTNAPLRVRSDRFGGLDVVAPPRYVVGVCVNRIDMEGSFSINRLASSRERSLAYGSG
jgi:hypothetical protein